MCIRDRTKALAKELGPSGVRVNCIAPGVIHTQMNGNLTPEDQQILADETPLCRLGTPEEAVSYTHLFPKNQNGRIGCKAEPLIFRCVRTPDVLATGMSFSSR